MTRTFWLLPLVGFLLVNAGCGNLCRRPLCGPKESAPKNIFVPPPPPSPLVPAGATFAPPTNFPATPPANATFGPPSGFPVVPQPGAPSAPPAITPIAPKDPIAPRLESKWQPGENGDAKPRVQLYAPESIEKEEPPLSRKPSVRATFPPIAQFAEVKEKIYAGLPPGKDGLDWLHSNRVGTIVNIRSPGEDDGADRKETEARGIRYIAVEVSPQNLTKEGFDGFIKLVRESSQQGVFVYDRDGSLAGSMWYLYLRWAEFLDDDAAQLRSRPLGLENTRDGQHRDMWLAVQKLLSENNR